MNSVLPLQTEPEEKKQVMRARFRRNPHTFLFCAPNERQHRKLRRKMNDMDSEPLNSRARRIIIPTAVVSALGGRDQSQVLYFFGSAFGKSCGFFLNSIREFGMNQQWSIQRSKEFLAMRPGDRLR